MLQSLASFLRRYSYPILGLLFVLFIILFFVAQGIESKQHIRYLSQITQLENEENRYSMELFRSRFRLRSDYDGLVSAERTIHQLLSELQAPPTYLDQERTALLQNLVTQLKQRFTEKLELISQFKSAKALYGNSVRYLPELHQQIEQATLENENSLTYAIHIFAEDMLTYLVTENNQQRSELLDRIGLYQKMAVSGQFPQEDAMEIAVTLLRHSRLILINLPLVESLLGKALVIEIPETLATIRETYLAGYKVQQQQTELSTNLLLLFTLVLFFVLIGAVINLRNTYSALEKSHDTLEQRVSERTTELAQAKEYAEKITHSMVEALLVTNEQGEILSFNPAAETLSGYTGELLQSLSVTQLLGEEVLKQHYPGGETRFHNGSGQEIPIEISRSTLTDSRNNSIGYTFVFHDLRERKHIEQQQQFLAFQSGVAEMGVTVMHNIGNIITGISGNLTRIKRSGVQLEKVVMMFESFAQQIRHHQQNALPENSTDEQTLLLNKSEAVFREGGKTLRNIIQGDLQKPLNTLSEEVIQIGNLLKLHKNESHPNSFKSTFDLHALLVDVIASRNQQIQQNRIQVNITIDDDIHQITLPRNQFMQMMIHMVDNSIAAIVLRADAMQGEQETGVIHFHASKTSLSEWQLQIEDNGTGITEEVQKEIFNFGFSTQHAKTGYGLHSVGNFVKSVDGEIKLLKMEGKPGATFSIIFPFT